jgi:hypothetical protein
MFTPIVSTTNTYHLYSLSELEKSSEQSIFNNTQHQNEWEVSAIQSTDTDKFLAHSVVSATEKLIAKFDETSFTKIASELGTSLYQQLNKILEDVSHTTFGDSINHKPSNTSTHTSAQSSNNKISAAEWQVFKESLDDLDGVW